MGAAYFYHLTRRPLEATLPILLEKALAAGWRVLVRGANPRRMDRLDAELWTWRDDAFLAHGLAGGDDDAAQPVLLALGDHPLGDRECLICIEGAGIEASEVAASERACILFDGGDPGAVDKARAQWRALTGAGARAQYWSEADGRWEKKAES